MLIISLVVVEEEGGELLLVWLVLEEAEGAFRLWEEVGPV